MLYLWEANWLHGCTRTDYEGDRTAEEVQALKSVEEEFEREIARVKRRQSKIKEATKRAMDEKLKVEEANAMSAGVEAQ